MNLIEFQLKFKDEQTCIDLLTEKRWGKDNAICPYCKSNNHCKHKTRNIYTCLDCKKQYTIRIGTIFEDSRLPLFKWFLAIYLFTSMKKGISSIQLSKYISVTQKTAWFLLQRIREVMQDDNDFFNGTCEIDETYIGGKAENKHLHARVKAKGIYKKAVAFGIVNRETKQVKAIKVADATRNTLQKEIYNNIKEGSILCTDEHKSYHSIGNSYNHKQVNHSQGEYSREEYFEDRQSGRKAFKIHTNTMEGFWSQLKRGIYGVYHWASEKHIQQYLNEFSYRYNYKDFNDYDKFENWFSSCENKRLIYKVLVG